MPKQILDRRGVPRGNYDYTVVKTGHRLEAHVFGRLVVMVKNHMAANGVEVPKDLEAIIEDDFCTRRPEYCRDTDAPRVNGEDAFTQVVAALAIPAADALATVSKLFGINCKACNQRHQVIRRLKQVGVAETLRQLKGTFTSG
jgi:hypothetical protein